MLMLIMTNLELPLYAVLYLQYDYMYIFSSLVHNCVDILKSYVDAVTKILGCSLVITYTVCLLVLVLMYFSGSYLTDPDPERCVEKYDPNRFKCT